MKDIISEIKTRLDELHDGADFSDIGNVIGFVLGKYESEIMGRQRDCFYDGFKHGLSVADGTHDKI